MGLDSRVCPLCGCELQYRKNVRLTMPFTSYLEAELYLCEHCGRYDLFQPGTERQELEQDQENRRLAGEFQAKVEAGLVVSKPFVCPQCGNLRRDRTCPICGCVMDLKTMTVLGGDGARKQDRGKKPDWEL